MTKYEKAAKALEHDGYWARETKDNTGAECVLLSVWNEKHDFIRKFQISDDEVDYWSSVYDQYVEKGLI